MMDSDQADLRKSAADKAQRLLDSLEQDKSSLKKFPEGQQACQDVIDAARNVLDNLTNSND